MSLVEFPPLNVEGRPYAIQEFNGRIINGNVEEFKAVGHSSILGEYPQLEKSGLGILHHGISKDNMVSVMSMQSENKFEQAWDRWSKDGFSGVVDHVASATESTKLWPISKLGRGVLKVHNGISAIASRIMPTMDENRINEIIEEYGTTHRWKTSWLRCVAVHNDGKRMAICQQNNFIRVYRIGNTAKKAPPLTIRHNLQQHITCMAWDPFDQRVLAVAAGSQVLLWKLVTKSASIQSSAECFRSIQLNSTPITQLVWDITSNSELMAISPNSNKIMLLDTTNGEVDIFGAWSGGNITKLIPTADGRRIAVLYTTNMIRVYERMTWSDEKWARLPGRATDAVWSPNGDFLLFSCENDVLYSISFTSRVVTVDSQPETKWIGDNCIISVFDVSPIEFDPSALNIRGSVERPIIRIGGRVRTLALSPDGQRLCLSFRESSSIVSLFIVDWSPGVRLIPSGLIEAPDYGSASIILFMPNFGDGSLLHIIWSGGRIQYIPLIYGANSSILSKTKDLLNEVNSRLAAVDRNSSLVTITDREAVISRSSVALTEPVLELNVISENEAS